MKKNINFYFAISFIAVLFGFSAAFLILPDSECSEEENRQLAQFPEFSVENLIDGSFTSDMNTYFSDQFPIRDELVAIKGVSETLFMKGENNGVLLGRDGQLAVRLFDIYKSRLEKTEDTDNFYKENIELSIKRYNEYCEKETRPLITLMPARTIDVTASAFDYPDYLSLSLNKTVTSSLSSESGYIDLLSPMKTAYENGEYVYYRTDHHWTTTGAYKAYTLVMKKWGMEEKIIPKKEFLVEKIPSFYGTTWSKAGMKFVEPDTMELWNPGNEEEFLTTCYKTVKKKDEKGKLQTELEAYKSFSGWISREHLKTKNKYAAFLDGTHNILTVSKQTGEKREKLLLIKDSFADSMVPFLAQHFDIVVINLANNITDASFYAEKFDCDRVLTVYNFENIIENTNLANIK